MVFGEKKPDSEEEKEEKGDLGKETKEKLKEGAKNFLSPEMKSKKIRNRYYLIAELINLYISGYISQVLAHNPLDVLHPISANVFVCIISALTIVPAGWICMALFNILIYFLYHFRIKSNDDDLGYSIADKNTYGSAEFLDEEEAKEMGILEFKDEIAEDETGNILGKYQGKYVIQPIRGVENHNMAAYGSPGGGKTVALVRPLVFQCVRRGESMVLQDPKGELANSMGPYLENEGYLVKYLNLKYLFASDAWNALEGLENDFLFVPVIADIIVSNGNIKFETFAGCLIRAGIYYVFECLPKEKQNFAEIYNLYTMNSAEGIKAIFSALPNSSRAKREYLGYDKASPNLKGNIITETAALLSKFSEDMVRKVTSNNDIDPELPGKQKCAYFVITPDTTKAFDFISSMFHAVVINRLVNYADSLGIDENGEQRPLPVKVQMILDEFPNTGKIPEVSTKISTVRSRGISIIIIMQGLSQMQRNYPEKEWESILNCCDTQLFLRANEKETLEYISFLSGDASIDVSTEGPAGTFGVGTGERRSVGRRELITPHEARTLKRDELYLVMSGADVLKCKKFNFWEHPDMDKLVFANRSMGNVPEWRKAEIEAKGRHEAVKYQFAEDGRKFDAETGEIMAEDTPEKKKTEHKLTEQKKDNRQKGAAGLEGQMSMEPYLKRAEEESDKENQRDIYQESDDFFM